MAPESAEDAACDGCDGWGGHSADEVAGGAGRHAALLKPTDVARWLCTSRSWVYAAAADGRLPSLRLGGQSGPLRFVAHDVEQWLAATRAQWLPGRPPDTDDKK